jgi:hypothetical protein
MYIEPALPRKLQEISFGRFLRMFPRIEVDFETCIESRHIFVSVNIG